MIIGRADRRPRPATARRVPRAVVRDVTAELHATLQELFDEAQRRAHS